MDGSHPPFRNVRGGMRKSFNFYLDFFFWSAWNDHFRSWATIYFQPWASTLRNASHFTQTNNSLSSYVEQARTRFAHMPPWQHGPRSYPSYSSESEHSRGKTLVFPRLRQFSVHKLSCQMNFCKMMNFQMTPLSKNFWKPCIFLPLLCLGTILAPTCPASCQPSCSPPPSSGSFGAAWFHPFSRSMTAPTRSCGAVPAPSPSVSGLRTRWLPSAVLRLTQLRTPRLAARVAAADRRTRVQAVLLQPSGSRFQTCCFFHLLLHQRCHVTVPEPFSYPAKRFLHAWDRRRLHSLQRCGTHPVSGHCPRG